MAKPTKLNAAEKAAGSTLTHTDINNINTKIDAVIDDYPASDHTHASLAGLVPVGGIVMWSGTIATIPLHWALCNGANSTPDLRDKFIVGAYSDEAGAAKTNISGSLTVSGGAVSHHHADHSLTQPAISNHTITQPIIGDHSITQPALNNHSITQPALNNHTYTTRAARTSASGTTAVASAVSAHSLSANVALSAHSLSTNVSLSSHSLSTNVAVDAHTLSVNAAISGHDSLTALQPYYSLAFIMRTD